MDTVFKQVFHDSRFNPFIFKLLSHFFKDDYNYLNDNYCLLNGELLKIRIKEKGTNVDALYGHRLELEESNEISYDKYIVEMNNYSNKSQRIKSFNYLSHVYAQSIGVGDKYNNYKKIKMLEFNYSCNYSKIDKEKEVYKVLTKDNRLYIDNVEIVNINLDIFEKMSVDECMKNEIYRYLKVMVTTSIEELDRLCKGDKILEKIKERVIELSKVDWNFRPHTYEQEIEMTRAWDRKEGYDEGIEKGIEQGIEKGIEKGIERGKKETIIENIKRMKKLKYNDDTISKILGIPKNKLNMYL